LGGTNATPKRAATRPGKRAITVFVDPAVAKELALYAIEHDTSVQATVEAMIVAALCAMPVEAPKLQATKAAPMSIERLRAAIAVPPTTNARSPLTRWLTDNREEFTKLMRDYRPRWEALVEQFAADGLLTLPAGFATDAEVRRRVILNTARRWDRVKAEARRAQREA
jgi:hypothetical protein